MSEAQTNTNNASKTWLDKLTHVLTGEPKDKEDLIEMLRDASAREVLDTNSLGMIEGVLEVHELRVGDVMIPRSHMTIITHEMPLEEILTIVVESGHSRFPVIGENKDEVLGIMLAKDILAHIVNHDKAKFNVTEIMRPAVFIPESKRLDVLLQDFRINRNHMAIVVDEYGGVTGLVTIEDVLEQIVGDIADEYDIEHGPFIRKVNDKTHIVKALTPIEEFNEYFNTALDQEEAETIGGLVLKQMGHLPKRGEVVEIEPFHFQILRADERRIHLMKLTTVQPEAANDH